MYRYVVHYAPQSLSSVKGGSLGFGVPLLDSHWLSATGWGQGSGTRGMGPLFQEPKEESHICKPFTTWHTEAGGGMTMPEKGLTGMWLGHQLYPSPQAWGILCPLQSLRSRMIP